MPTHLTRRRWSNPEALLDAAREVAADDPYDPLRALEGSQTQPEVLHSGEADG